MTIQDVLDNIKKLSESLSKMSEQELKEWADKQLEEPKLMPVITKYSFINPNECYVTMEEYDEIKSRGGFIEHGFNKCKGDNK